MTEETFNILSTVKQQKALEEQTGLEENIITEILKKRDVNKAYKIALEACILFYHLTDRNDFLDEEAYCRAFPFLAHFLDAGTVAQQLLKEYELKKHIW